MAEACCYFRFSAKDQSGAIAEIAIVQAQHKVGISGTHSPVDANNPDADFDEMVFLLQNSPLRTT